MPRKTFRDIVEGLARSSRELRGSVKLRTALDHFDVSVSGLVALDVGAAAGGFTRVLLERGAGKVYAVDVGHGQLLGSLRQDARVVNLESTNIADLSRELVPDAIDIATVDVSYLSLGEAVRQLTTIEIAPGARVLGLVKPMFELRLATAPTDEGSLTTAVDRARSSMEEAGWQIASTLTSGITGARGAVEAFVLAERAI